MNTSICAELVLVAAAGFGQPGAIELTGPLASDGGVELVEVCLQRSLKGRLPEGGEGWAGGSAVVPARVERIGTAANKVERHSGSTIEAGYCTR